MRNYEELKVYQMAEDLVIEVYKFTQLFPSEERFGLIGHLRKTALSISFQTSGFRLQELMTDA